MNPPGQPPHHCPGCTCEPPRQTGTAWLYSEDEKGRPHHQDDHPWIRTMPTAAPATGTAVAVTAMAVAVLAITISLAVLAITLAQ